MQQARISQFFRPAKKPRTAASETAENSVVEVDALPVSQSPPSLSISQLVIPESDEQTARQLRAGLKRLLEEEEVSEKPTSSKDYTPLERQVLELRAAHPDCLLMVECGYRMRFFGQDASLASEVLGIFAHYDHNFLVASVPTYRAFVHCQRLLRAGHKVAIVRQTETAAIRKAAKAKASATFSRKVTGVFTYGTLINDDDPAFEGLSFHLNAAKAEADESEESSGEPDAENTGAAVVHDAVQQTESVWIAAVHEDHCLIAIAAINVAAGQLQLSTLTIDPLRQALQDFMDMLQPHEVVLSNQVTGETRQCLERRKLQGEAGLAPTQSVPRYINRLISMSAEEVRRKKTSYDWLQHDSSETLKTTVSALAAYLASFGLDQALSEPSIITNCGAVENTQSFPLDGITARDLEVFVTHHALQEDDDRVFNNRISADYPSLLSLLDNCKSGQGKRVLKTWLMNPLLQREQILARQQVVNWLLEATSQSFIGMVHGLCKSLPDIDKVLTSLQFRRISPTRLLALLKWGLKVAALFGDGEAVVDRPALLQSWIKTIDCSALPQLCSRFLKPIDSVDAASLTGIFASEYELQQPELMMFGEEKRKAEEQMQNLLLSIRKQLRRPSLEYSSLRTGGAAPIEHLIVLPLSDEHLADANWIKVNVTKQVARFHPLQVLAAQNELYRVRDEIKIAMKRMWRDFVGEVKQELYSLLRNAVQALGCIDAAISLSVVANYPNYVQPHYPVADQELRITEGRHPMLDHCLSHNEIIANDVHLSRQPTAVCCQIITGPNMGGKSSYVRMIALICLLGQIGSHVPAATASLCIFDHIFTRMGAEDDLSAGRSTFMCELVRLNKILRSSTGQSLVVIDELGRGTSTHDGQALAMATLTYLLRRIGGITFFITHFHEMLPLLASDAQLSSRYSTGHMSYVETTDDDGDPSVLFLYRCVDGPSAGSYGINVAKLAGLPKSVLQRALQLATEYCPGKDFQEAESR